MQRFLLPVVVVLMSTIAQAQTPAQSPDEPCLLATDKDTWLALGLSADQVEQVSSIQTTCKTDCAAVSETGERDARTAAAVLEQHQERVRMLLTEKQYDAWQAWCSERTTRGQLK